MGMNLGLDPSLLQWTMDQHWKLGVGLRCSLFKVLAKLEEAWINERNSPELLHPRMEMVEESKVSLRNKITHF